MKHIFLLLSCTFLISCSLYSQASNAPLLMATSGTVWYQSGGGAKNKVYTGSYLVPPGTIILEDKASAEVIYKDKFIQLTKAGKHDIVKLFGGTSSSGGFVNRFSNFVGRGLDQSASNKKLEKAFEKNQSNAQGNTRGFGDQGLFGVLPFGGTLSPEETLFTWQPIENATYYELRLIDSTSEEMIFMALCPAPRYLLSTADLLLVPENTYYWEATPVIPRSSNQGPTLGASPTLVEADRIHFRYQPTDLDDLLTPIRGAEIYRKSLDPIQQKLMEAMELEDNNFLYAAYSTYREAMEQSDNALLRRSYAAFLARWNLRKAAKELLEQD